MTKRLSKEELAKVIADYLPYCPICKAAADYKVVDFYKTCFACKSCDGRWSNNELPWGQLKKLKLIKHDNQKRAKPLMKKEKTVKFWQSLDLAKYDPQIDKEVNKLIRRIRYSRRGDKEAAVKLREIGEPTFEKLSLMLCESYVGDRQAAAAILGYLGDARGVGLLMPLLKDQDASMRLQAVISLPLIEEKEEERTGQVVAPLIDVLRTDKDTNVRFAVAQCFGFFKWDPKVTDALIEALADAGWTTKETLFGISFGPSVREMAALSLGKIGTKKALEAMVPFALGEWKLKYAVEVFSHVGDAAKEHLVKALDSEDDNTRRNAKGVLEKVFPSEVER